MFRIKLLLRLCVILFILSTTRGTTTSLFHKWRQLQGGSEGDETFCVVRKDDSPSAERALIQYFFSIESSEAVSDRTIDELELYLFYILYASILWCPANNDRKRSLLRKSITEGKSELLFYRLSLFPS